MSKLKLGLLNFFGAFAVLSALALPVSAQRPDPTLQKLGLGSGFGNCEINSATLDNLRSASEEKQVTVIAIARLGKGEMSRELNRRRLYTVRTYLSRRQMELEKLVVAEGDRVSGYGRVDFYVDGKLFAALVADTCKDLPVGECIEDFNTSPYYLPRRGRTRWCR